MQNIIFRCIIIIFTYTAVCKHKRNTAVNSNMVSEDSYTYVVEEDPQNPQSASKMMEDFKRAIFDEINFFRYLHRAKAIVPSDELNDLAQEWAEHLAKIDNVEYQNISEVGESIFSFRTRKVDFYPRAFDVVYTWYKEKKNYDFTDPENKGNLSETRNFCQMVWKGTREMGTGYGRQKHDDFYKHYTVVLYKPAGNIAGSYLANVEKDFKVQGGSMKIALLPKVLLVQLLALSYINRKNYFL